MKKSSFINTILASLLLFANTCFSGTDPAAFLNVGIGARALGIGGSFVSVSDDNSAIYWNPAGLGKVKKISIITMSQSNGSMEWETLKDVSPTYQFIGITFPVNTFKMPGLNTTSNTFGIGMIASSLVNIPYTRVESGKIVRETFEDYENAYFVSYGAPLLAESNSICVGATLKYITQKFSKIAGATASGFDMDFGIIFTFSTLSLGFVFQRGVDLRWENGHTDSASLTTKFGVSNKFRLGKFFSLLGSTDIIQRKNQPILANAGAELGYEKWIGTKAIRLEGLYLRFGLDGFAIEDRYGYSDKINNNFNYTAGAGINVACFGRCLQIDFAMGSYRLGNKNRLSLSLYF